MKVQIKVDYENCTGCGTCVEKCPMEVYDLKDDKVVIKNEKDCMVCWLCETECPQQAIIVQEI